MKRAAMVVLCLWAAACGDDGPHAECPLAGCTTQVSWRKTYATAVDRELDVLFVVDDTPAMAPYADAYASGLADMAATLAALPQPASLHVGFVRAGACDVSTRGAACGLATPEQFVRQEWCQMTTNFPGAFADAFSCLGDLGVADCAPEQPLAAAAQALAAPPRPGWEGFLRPEAYLLVVVIAAGDDASSGPATDVATFIRGLKQDPSPALASAIVPSRCAAAAPQRLIDFVGAFGGNGVILDLCDGQFAPALQLVARTISEIVDPACVSNVRDTDPATPGLQAACTFTDHVAANGSYVDSSIPSCDDTSGTPPCWRLVTSDACRPGYVVDIERGADWCDEAGQFVTVECLACADANDPACAPPAQAR